MAHAALLIQLGTFSLLTTPSNLLSVRATIAKIDRMERAMFKSCAVGLMVLMATTGVSAVANDEPQPTDKKQKLICKSDGVTGSRLKKRRTCMTVEQWDQLRAQTQKDLADYSRSAGKALQAENPMGGP
jgi:hypothetical protein